MKEEYKQIEILKPTESYVVKYPQFIELADLQAIDCYWTEKKIKVAKDIQDMLVNLEPESQWAIQEALRIFTHYETIIGNEYWNGVVRKNFPRPEVERMASVFGMFELQVHAPFYNKLNDALGLSSDEFYESYKFVNSLKERIDSLHLAIGGDDPLVSIALFSLAEGVSLFSIFSLLKSFSSNGYKYMSTVNSGINQSVIDEGLHQQGGALLFTTALSEIPFDKYPAVIERITKVLNLEAEKLYQNECAIVDHLLPKGEIETGITSYQLKQFILHRFHYCFNWLGLKCNMPTPEDTSIQDWFYRGVTSFQVSDHFLGIGKEYTHDWNEDELGWGAEEKTE